MTTATRSARPRHVIRTLLRRPASAIAVGFIGILVFFAIAGPLVYPYDPEVQDLGNRFAEVSWTHLLGTDEFGRDVASRIIQASRIAVTAPLISVGVALLIGLPLGLGPGCAEAPSTPSPVGWPTPS